MKKIATLASIALLAWGGAAQAHGGTRQKVVEGIEIDASPEAVWNLIKDFGDARWMPQVASSAAHTGEKGTIRELVLKKGGVIKEELKELDANTKTLKYRVHEEPDCAVFPVNNYSAILAVTASGSGAKVEWTSAAYRCFTPNNPPPGQDEKAAVEAMEGFSKEGLAGLKVLAEKSGNPAAVSASPPALDAPVAVAASRQPEPASSAGGAPAPAGKAAASAMGAESASDAGGKGAALATALLVLGFAFAGALRSGK